MSILDSHPEVVDVIVCGMTASNSTMFQVLIARSEHTRSISQPRLPAFELPFLTTT